MPRVSSKFEGQLGSPLDPAPQFGPALNAEPDMGVEIPGVSSTGEDNAEFGISSFEANAQHNVERFDPSNLGEEGEEDLSSLSGDQFDGSSYVKPPVYQESQVMYWIVGSIALMVGGIALRALLNKKGTTSGPYQSKQLGYRRRASRLDSRKEVRGAFKPSERFLKPKGPKNLSAQQSAEKSNDLSTPEVRGGFKPTTRFLKPENSPADQLVDLSTQAGVSSLTQTQSEPAMQQPAPSSDEEFDFTADLDEAGGELFELEELVEADSEAPETFDSSVSLSARPPESLQDCELSFVAPASLQTSHFVNSSPAEFSVAKFEYSGNQVAGFREGEFGSEQNPESVVNADEPATDAAVQNDIELEQEANEFARNFFSDESNDHPVSAINEDEEAVMNLHDDDSDIEFDFDLDDAVEIDDSDADFNFDLDVDDVSDKSLSGAAVGAVTGATGLDAVVDSVQSVEPTGDGAQFDLGAESVEIADDDDSAEFAAMFDDSSEDLGNDLSGIELDAPVVSAQAVDAIDDSEIELAEFGLDDADPVSEVAAVADDAPLDVDEFDIDLDDSVEVAAEEVGAPTIGSDLGSKIGDAVGDIGDKVSQTAEGAAEGLTEKVEGLSGSAKTAAVAAGAAGAAAGGGFLTKLFGWGKKKKVADADAVQELAEETASIEEVSLDDLSDEIVVSESNEVADAIASVESEVDLDVADEVEFDLGIESDSDEFDFSMDDDESPAALADLEDSAEIEIADDEIVAVEDVGKASVNEADSAIDLLDESDEFDLDDDSVDAFDFADVDSAQNEDKKGFSSMETLRDPEPDPVAAKSGFTSADTLREPETDPVAAKSEFSSAETLREPAPDSVVAKTGFSSADTLREPDSDSVAAKSGFSSAETLREPEPASEPESDGLGVAAIGGAALAGAAALVGLNKSTEPSQIDADLQGKNEALEIASSASALDSKNDALVARIQELEKANGSLKESTNSLMEKLMAREEELAAKEGELAAKVAESDSAAKAKEEELAAKAAESDSASKAEQEELVAKVEELEKAKKAEQEELIAKVEELEQANKDLNESTQSLEEKLEAQTAETESAIAQVEKDYAAKLEESATGQADLTTELESLKAELAEAKSSVAEAASEASEMKDAELEKVRADLESAQSSENSLNREIESLKQQLADATASQADDDDGMPTSSLMGAVGLGGLGAAGLMGGKSLMDKSAEPAPTNSPVDDELKKRFEKRLKAERKARKDAQAQLEQAEEQRNAVAKTLRGVKKELVEAQKNSTGESAAKDDSPQLKALESQLERQSEKMKTMVAENEKITAQLKSAQDSIADLNTENSELKKKSEVAQSTAAEEDRARIESLQLELDKLTQDNKAKHLVAEKLTVELRGSLAEKETALASKIEELKTAVADKDRLSAEAQQLRNTLREEASELTSQLTSARSLVTSLENEKAGLNTKVAQLANQPSQGQARLNEAQGAQIKQLQGKLQSQEAAQLEAATLAEDQARQISELSNKLQQTERQLADAEKSSNPVVAEAAAPAKHVSPQSIAERQQLKSEIDSLQAKLKAHEKSVAQHQQLKSEMSIMRLSHATQLKEAMAAKPLGDSGSSTSSSQSQVGELKAELQAQEKRIMELESENHETHEKLAAMMKLRAKEESLSKSSSGKKKKPATSKPASSKPASSKPASSKSASSKPASSNKRPVKDDLTRIVGIGKVYQGRLRKIGVTSFEQIAAWTKKDADAIEDKLGFGERISNEKWIKQAKALARKKAKK